MRKSYSNPPSLPPSRADLNETYLPNCLQDLGSTLLVVFMSLDVEEKCYQTNEQSRVICNITSVFTNTNDAMAFALTSSNECVKN